MMLTIGALSPNTAIVVRLLAAKALVFSAAVVLALCFFDAPSSQSAANVATWAALR